MAPSTRRRSVAAPPTRRPFYGGTSSASRKTNITLAPYGRDLRDIEGVALDKSKRQREANGSEVDFESLYVVAQQARDSFEELVDQALRFSEYAEAPAPAPASLRRRL